MRVAALLASSALVLGACSASDPSSSPATDDPPASMSAEQGSDERQGTTAVTGIKLRKLVSLSQPVALAVRPGDDHGAYIAEKAGRVVRIRGSRVTGEVLDIRDLVSADGERGLLGIAFSPNGGRLYANYTDNGGDTNVVWFKMRGNKARRGSRTRILEINQPYSNHNGGHIAIGPDQMLYIATGDGGSAGDPQGNGQDRGTLLGKILRIDPRGDPYRSPPDNPFVGQSGRRNEILHYGLRNPWRFAIDEESNTMWIGDVGQNVWEEINRVPLAKRGANFGWARMEGRHSYNGRTAPSNHHAPIHEYSHGGGGCSVTGGVVLRDPRMPRFDGRYLFSDFCDGTIRYLRKTSNGWRAGSFGISRSSVASFGTLANGRAVVLSLGGSVWRIDPRTN